MSSSSQYDIIQICDDIKSMLLEKNEKYGDSALNPTRIMSKCDAVEQIKVRIDDKLSRLSQGNVDDDEDVINDLIGYLVLLKIAQQRQGIIDDFENSDLIDHLIKEREDDENVVFLSGVDNKDSSRYNKSHTPNHYFR